MFAGGRVDQLSRGPSCLGAELTVSRLARHARLDLLDWLDKVERVESSRVETSQVEFEPNLLTFALLTTMAAVG